jgi:hypothetical protein
MVDSVGLAQRHSLEIFLAWRKRGGKDESVNVTTLEDAEGPFKDIHDGIVKPFPVINHIIIVDTSNYIGRAIIFSMVFEPLFSLVVVVPPTFSAFSFLNG